MKKYIGTKTVQAEPMNECEAFGANLTRERLTDRDWEEGYIVYEGSYERWSPKDVFEKTYKVADTFLDRLEIEESELEVKIDKLQGFWDTDTYQNLSQQHKNLLDAQYSAMVAYHRILKERRRVIKEDQANLGK